MNFAVKLMTNEFMCVIIVLFGSVWKGMARVPVWSKFCRARLEI